METLYQKSTIIKSLRAYFTPYIRSLTKPSGHKMLLLLLAMMAMQFTTSINHLFKWFLAGISGISLNSYYYLLSYTEIPLDRFFKITVQLAMSLIPAELDRLPVFLIIDDTLQAKYGTHFECRQTMFDHTKRNGTNYLNGHCFVALGIRIPVAAGSGIRYLHVPVGYRLRKENENKLTIASEMVGSAMEVLTEHPMVILLCDSWYPKGKVIETVQRYPNLELIANARADTCVFNLAPGPTGRRGRPGKRGKQLDIHTDFNFIRVDDCFIAARAALTNLFGALPVHVTVTTPDITNHGAYRVFISTVMPRRLNQQLKGYEKTLSDSLHVRLPWLLPLFLYSFRWSIEVLFYEQKKFWSLGLYRLRKKQGIENFVNLTSLCYACMKMLPYMDDHFTMLRNESPQTCKYLVGDSIRLELFLWRFAQKSETPCYSSSFFDDHFIFKRSDSLCNVC